MGIISNICKNLRWLAYYTQVLITGHDPDYDLCMRPGCGHGRIEHGFGIVGCRNAACPCASFWEKEELYGFMQELALARTDAVRMLGQVPGVVGVESDACLTLYISTYMKDKDPEKRLAVYKTESELMAKHITVNFDFHVLWDIPKE